MKTFLAEIALEADGGPTFSEEATAWNDSLSCSGARTRFFSVILCLLHMLEKNQTELLSPAERLQLNCGKVTESRFSFGSQTSLKTTSVTGNHNHTFTPRGRVAGGGASGSLSGQSQRRDVVTYSPALSASSRRGRACGWSGWCV